MLVFPSYHLHQGYVSLKHEGDKVIVFERVGLVFIFNFHPSQSFVDYRVGVDVPGKYRVVLSSDEKRFGGFDNIKTDGKFFTTPMEWNNSKNWVQVSELFWDAPLRCCGDPAWGRESGCADGPFEGIRPD